MTPRLHPDFLRLPIAHRALHDLSAGRPENSRAAIKAAIEKGYGIEIDIQRSADDVAMVFHDYNLMRLTEREGRVDAYTATDLSGMILRGGEDGIPTLSEVLEVVNGQVPLLVEIKDQDGEMGPNVGALEASVARELKRYAGPVAVMSFNPYSVMEMARRAPDVPRGLTTGAIELARYKLLPEVYDRLKQISDFDDAGCSFISNDINDLQASPVAALKARGADILCWTVRSPQEEAKARQIAHNITFENYEAPFPA